MASAPARGARDEPREALVVSLRAVDQDWLPRVGGKAAQLGAMMRGGLPVPEGFCLTTEAYRRGLDAELAEQVRNAYGGLGGCAVAVRSSATAEDLPEASFAGQQETFLNVSGEEALLRAIQDCWQSLFSERAVAYRRDRGIPDADVAMGVVVQRMVPAEVAGVLFTVNPVTGANDELVIEGARGLGDQVVSARVTPCRYRLRRAPPYELISREGEEAATLLSAEWLRELARLGLAAEQALGRAADIEWAVDAAGCHLLQARAVTAAGAQPPKVEYGSRWNQEACQGRLIFWSNHNVRETMPYPHTPFSWSMWKHLLIPHMLVGMGLVAENELDRPEEVPAGMELVEGRIYWNLNVCAGLFGPRILTAMTRTLDTEAADILATLLRSGELKPVRSKGMRRRYLRALWRTLQYYVTSTNPKAVWRALMECQQEADSVSKIDPAILSEEQILAVARYYARESLMRGVRAQLRALACSFSSLAALAFLQKKLPRWGMAEPLAPLLSGIAGNTTLETALALWDLAEGAPAEVRAVFGQMPIAEIPQALEESEAGRDFLGHMAEFLERHGHRAVREFDLACPRWKDDPTFLYESLRNYMAHPADQPTPRQHYERQMREHEEFKARVEHKLARHPLRRGMFRRAVRFYEDRIHLREAPKFYGLRGVATLRDLYLEVGRRLVARSTIQKPEDFFFLSIPELEQLCAGELDEYWARQIIPQRRREFEREMRASPPLVLRSDGRAVARPVAAAGEALQGTAASWGVVQGPARILMDPSEGARLHKGEILVAPFTDPGWTPLFLTAGGLVMEIGGIMSHGAVVAREYGIPAVVGVKDATRLLRKGELIEVDGAAGEVRRKKEEGRSQK